MSMDINLSLYQIQYHADSYQEDLGRITYMYKELFW